MMCELKKHDKLELLYKTGMKFMIFFNKSEQLNQTISAISQQDEQLK